MELDSDRTSPAKWLIGEDHWRTGLDCSAKREARARNQKTMGNVPKSEETGVPVTAEASKAEERAARRVDDRELVRKAQRGEPKQEMRGAEGILESVPSVSANDDVLASMEKMP
jgi:hypothetical protein